MKTILTLSKLIILSDDFKPNTHIYIDTINININSYLRFELRSKY